MGLIGFLSRLGYVGLACGLLAGCITSRHPAGIAESTAPISGDFIRLGKVEASSCSAWFLFLPLGAKERADTIINRLIEEKGADSLVGVTVEHSHSLFSIPIAGENCTTVKGQAVRVSQ